MAYDIQYFKFYKVDPVSWLDTEELKCITSASINRDVSTDTLGSANFETDRFIGEMYIRVYFIKDESERICFGTYLVQTPSVTYNDASIKFSLQAYTSLSELKENTVPVGYSYDKKAQLNPRVFSEEIIRQHMRAPLNKAKSFRDFDIDIAPQVFIANDGEDWLSFLKFFLKTMDVDIRLDSTGAPYFVKIVEYEKQDPTYTYTDDNSSVLLEEITTDYDLYSKPNVVRIHFVNAGGNELRILTRKNEVSSSPFSVQSRGREIVKDIETTYYGSFNPTDEALELFANKIAKEIFSINYTVRYTHGYCPVNIGDTVILNYRQAGLENIKAFVTSQSFSCQTGLTVQETAIFKSDKFLFNEQGG